jgi:hypothetical protein
MNFQIERGIRIDPPQDLQIMMMGVWLIDGVYGGRRGRACRIIH